ncbi:MAG: hypothetical protein PHP95_05555 [Desulfuromonadaceae bacterium]|nr:hypothetical protein [Desulfuromonadaceae bacterium]MDD2847905.1 hypothetical protein [Desulfuromonadaceae bacterium]MDD4129550.1 hypothetical protein [Desulfuromonadaceae bacterium]
MLNLLFISDSPKTESIKSELQPFLKVIIDVVTDFDSGLRDVFEKRPTVVCIQDQIGTVTGESVARHIQMLLGSGAPTFILLHTGKSKAKAIKGLYESVIDLGQPGNVLAEEVKNSIKLLLGDKWDKIYIPPKPAPVAAKPSLPVTAESRENADKLVDGFLSDLKMSGLAVTEDQPQAQSVSDELIVKPPNVSSLQPGNGLGNAEADRAKAINDDLVELLLLESGKAWQDERSAAVSDGVNALQETVSPEIPKPKAAAVKPQPVVSAKSPAAPVAKPQPAAAPAAAEFRISRNTIQEDDHIPEDVLLEFEQSYRPASAGLRRGVVIALGCAICVASVWYLVNQKPQLVNSLKQRLIPASVTKPETLSTPVTLVVPVQKPVSTPVPSLPAFIPKNGYDASFAVKNPGWQRYVGKDNEFRVFKTAAHIQAVQVLSVKDAPVSESLLKSVLQELAGSADYKITSRSKNAGIHIENGTIQDKAEIVIYRKNRDIKAFVVSIN